MAAVMVMSLLTKLSVRFLRDGWSSCSKTASSSPYIQRQSRTMLCLECTTHHVLLGDECWLCRPLLTLQARTRACCGLWDGTLEVILL